MMLYCETFGILFLCEDKDICRFSDLHRVPLRTFRAFSDETLSLLIFTCSKSKIGTLEEGVKYVQI